MPALVPITHSATPGPHGRLRPSCATSAGSSWLLRIPADPARVRRPIMMMATHPHSVALGLAFKVARAKPSQSLGPGRSQLKVRSIRGDSRDRGEVDAQLSRRQHVRDSETTNVPGDSFSGDMMDPDRQCPNLIRIHRGASHAVTPLASTVDSGLNTASRSRRSVPASMASKASMCKLLVRSPMTPPVSLCSSRSCRRISPGF